nr:hypothetical protein [Tanacetum cinerariifolium]
MALWKSQMEDHTFDWLRVVPIFGLGQTINGLDVCVDLKGFSPWTQTVMVYFVPGHAVIDATHRKRVKYEAKIARLDQVVITLASGDRGQRFDPHSLVDPGAPASGLLLTGSSLLAASSEAREEDERHQESRQDRSDQIMLQQVGAFRGTANKLCFVFSYHGKEKINFPPKIKNPKNYFDGMMD